MVNKVKTDKVKAVLGISPGYYANIRQRMDSGDLILSISKKYQEIAEFNFLDHKKLSGDEVYVSAVISPSNTVYRYTWGCPLAGEPTFNIECTRNPEFIKDYSVYIEMATKNIMDLKKELQQCTVLIEYSKLECAYITE